MKRGHIYFLGALIAIIGFLIMDYNIHKVVILEKSNQRSIASSVKKSPTASLSSGSSLGSKTLSPALESFKVDFFKEASMVGQLQRDPDQAELRMQVLADRLTPLEISFLSSIASDINRNGDERSMAIEVLSLNTSFDAHRALKDFIENESFGFGAQVDFELALRAQAIEGLVNYTDKSAVIESLVYLKAKTRYSFLNEREERALSFVRGYTPAPEKIDNEALKQLITK